LAKLQYHNPLQGYQVGKNWILLITPICAKVSLKINTHKGLPCGNEGFIRKLSDKVGRDLSFKKRGRPKKGIDISKTGNYEEGQLTRFVSVEYKSDLRRDGSI
jgi:hypothetical protein